MERGSLDLMEMLALMPSLKDGDRRTLLKMANLRRAELALRENLSGQSTKVVETSLSNDLDELEEIRVQMVAVPQLHALAMLGYLSSFLLRWSQRRFPQSNDDRVEPSKSLQAE
jgi:hypothetical protein